MISTAAARLGGRDYRAEVMNLPAPGKDQDAFRVSDGFVAVADGATPLGGEPGSSVRAFADAALDGLASRRDEPAARMVRTAIRAARQHGGHHSPPLSCTLALARTERRRIEFVVLGDCTAVVEDAEGRRETIRDHRLDRIDGAVVERLAALMGTGMSAEDAELSVKQNLIDNRMRMNTPDSYWSFSTEPAAAKHVLHRLRDANTVSAVLICSDGFARLADTFHAAAGMAGLMKRCRREGLASLGDELRALERAPESLARFPRLNRHDDATAILLVSIEDPADRD